MAIDVAAKFSYKMGYASDLSLEAGAGYMRQGSENAMATGSELITGFKGCPLAPGSLRGTNQSFQTDGGYTGLGSAEERGTGSVFKTDDLLLTIGSGAVVVNGIDTTRTATTNLAYLKRTAGEFNSSCPSFQVGHPRPDKPTLFVKQGSPSPDKKPITLPGGSGAVVVVAIHRADSLTGQPSICSPVSDQLEVNNTTFVVQIDDLPDSNGQDLWGVDVTKLGVQLSNLYELPVELGGEVTEAYLSATRAVTGASIADGTSTVDVTEPAVDRQFTATDIGDRIVFGGFDTWITGVITPLQVTVNDENDTGSTISGTATVTHGVDGHLRAVEIGYSDDDLLGQPFAPTDVFEPPDGVFASRLGDTHYVVDLEGTIFYSLPDTFSFARKTRKIYTDETPVAVRPSGNGYDWFVGKHSYGRLSYIGGDNPLQLEMKQGNIGAKFQENVEIGYDGRLMVWSGKPTVIDPSWSYNSTFHAMVASEFDGWDEQTVDQPVVAKYDPLGDYELWIYGKKVMALHATTGRWCAPITLDIEGIIVGGAISDGRLLLFEKIEGQPLRQRLWNSGEGTVMTLVSQHQPVPRTFTCLNMVTASLRSGQEDTGFTFSVIKNFNSEVEIGYHTVLGTVEDSEQTPTFRPNLRGVKHMALKVVVDTAVNGATVDNIEVYGERTEAFAG